MYTSGVSTLLNTSSLLPSSARAELQALNRDEAIRESRPEQSHDRDHGRGRALGIFRQALRTSIKAQFSAPVSAEQPGYAQFQESATTDDVAAEVIGVAKRVVAESPTRAAQSLISFRATVHEVASYVRETVGSDGDVEQTVAKVDESLDNLDDEISKNRESSASVLDIDTRSKQQSTIRIRTQEGDIVNLVLKQVDSLSATDVATGDGDSTTTTTQVAVSSSSGLLLEVEGDLNESELAAIQNVFAQAEQIASEFFGGDIVAAFDLAQGFEFDTEQLARVKMGFKLNQESNISYAETVPPAITAPELVQEPLGPPVAEAIVSNPLAPVAASNVADVPAAGNAVSAVADQADGTAPLETSALSGFFDALSTFLRSVGEGFETGSSSGSFRFHYSESFKLELLKAVIHTVAPDDSTAAAASAGTLIDAVAEAGVTG